MNYKNYPIGKIVKPLAVVLALFVVFNFTCPFLHAIAVDVPVSDTVNGFYYWTDVNPPNQLLISGYNTGVVSNPSNSQIYCACVKLTNYYGFKGICIFSEELPSEPITISNVNGEYADAIARWGSVVVNNEVVGYINTAGIEGRDYQNNYPYAEFTYNQGNYQFTPANETALNFINYALHGTQIETGGNLNYSLPAGNIAIIQTSSKYSSIKLSTTMPLISSSFSQNPWPNTTQRIGFYNNLPENINPSVMGNVIEWQKTGDKTLFGNTNNAIYEPSVISKFTYVVITNPYYYPANNMEDNQYTNGAINIQMDDVVSIEVRNLTASVNTSTGEIENSQNGNSWTGEIDDNTGDIIWTDNNGDNTIPEGGGNLSNPTITGFQSWLKGILTSIRDIFEPAHDAIQTISSAVRNFSSWMYALYVWLPAPVLNLLTSAISLAIVIGVIKVFV